MFSKLWKLFDSVTQEISLNHGSMCVMGVADACAKSMCLKPVKKSYTSKAQWVDLKIPLCVEIKYSLRIV